MRFRRHPKAILLLNIASPQGLERMENFGHASGQVIG